jgi:hypothetical protein
MTENSAYVFAAAICRGKAEGGNGCEYFGSFGGWSAYYDMAVGLCWIGEDGELTELGRRLGERCSLIGKNRVYFYCGEYVEAIKEIVGEL